MQIADARRERIDSWVKRITRWITLFVRWFSAHWLLMANIGLGVYAGLPVLAPILVQLDYPGPARIIYLVFQPLCHQLPERSLFLFGERWIYSYEQLSALLRGMAVPQRWTGLPGIGFKVAVCERDVAIYASMLLAGILFNLVRHRLKPLPLKVFGILILPMAVDGLGQLFGLWTSTWLSRLITGGLFGVSCIWLAFPYLEQGMREVHDEVIKAFQEQRV